MRQLIGTLVCLLFPISGRVVAQEPSAVAASGQLVQAETDLRTVDRSHNTQVDADEQKRLRTQAVASGRIQFNCVAHVSSPCPTYAARTNILLAIFHRLQVADVLVGTASQQPDPAGDVAHA